MGHRRSFHIVFALLVTCFCLSSPAYTQPSGYEGYQVVRIEITDEADLDVLRDLLTLYPDFELWSEALGIGPMDVRVAPVAARLLDASDLCYDVIVADLQKHIDELYGLHVGGRGGDFFDYLRTYDEHVQFMTDLVAAYPDLAEMIDLGLSVEGRPLWALRITGPGDDKPGVMYHGAQHGDEQEGASVVAYAAHHILTNYDSDPDITTLVDNVEWFLLPIMNPDAYEAYQRYNAHGVDLNRNWGGPGSGYDYRPGPFQFSEPETAAMRDFFLAYANVRAHIDVHGYTDLLAWPWGHTSDRCLDHRTFRLICREMRDLIDLAGGGSYRIGPISGGISGGGISGGSIDYTYGVHSIWAFLFEMQESTLPDICEHFLPAMLYLSGRLDDCNDNGIPDVDDIATGVSDDCNSNAVPDECESERDCNADGVLDICDFADGTATDCNGNSIPDQCDIADGVSYDSNANGVPDECEPDCNGNGIVDECDIDCGDEDGPCDEPGCGMSSDCNSNAIPDECDIADGTSGDCDDNGVPDECELNGVGRIDLEQTLILLDANHASIADLIASRFDFSEGEIGDEIVDGGENMYDGGNRLNTNLALRIPYTNGVITPGDDEFGPGSRYFTAKYPGLFVMVAANIGVEWFSVLGTLGNGGQGVAEVTHNPPATVVNGETYTIFDKRVYEAETPSVWHILILRGDEARVRHGYYNAFPESDTDSLFGLGTRGELIYLLFAIQAGENIWDTQFVEVAEQLLLQVVREQYADCNANGRPDACDLADGTSEDVNGNGIPDECECCGDLDRDNDVDLADLAQLLGSYGESAGMTYEDGDLDGDGDVDLADLAELLGVYGTVCAECPGDLDGDNDVDLADLAQLLGSYGESTGMSYEDGDLDGDWDVDLADLAELLWHYGEICE